MNESTQTGVAMAVIGMIGTIAGLLIGWLRDRDKLQFDAKLVAQANQIALQDSKIVQLEAGQKRCEENERKLEECEKKHTAMEVRMSLMESSVAPAQDKP